MEESWATAQAHAVEPGITVERAYANRLTTSHRSSMLLDFERHHPPEIDRLLTAVQEFARVAAVPTPHVDSVTALVIEKAGRQGLY